MNGWASGVTTSSQLDSALVAAEKLLVEVERGRRGIRTAAILTVLAFAAALTGHISISAWASVDGTGWVIVPAVLLPALVLAAVIPWMISTRRRLVRAERTMIELVTPAREAFPLIASREGWSDARRQVLLARLRQFPIVARGR